MQSFSNKILDVLHRRGAVEIGFLVRTVLKSAPVKKTEKALMEEILKAALNGKAGITVVEYPTYSLRIAPESLKLPAGKYVRTALLALKEAKLSSINKGINLDNAWRGELCNSIRHETCSVSGSLAEFPRPSPSGRSGISDDPDGRSLGALWLSSCERSDSQSSHNRGAARRANSRK